MISKREVQHVANLARLALTKKETEAFRKELSLVLGYIDKLKKLDVSGIKEISHPLEMSNQTRKDEAFPEKPEVRKRLMTQAPESRNGYIRVKQIL
jgi:aspartyl-tRNA(Asn)/glutamyl-tRNA(Gln) amidotransferase subunit C